MNVPLQETPEELSPEQIATLFAATGANATYDRAYYTIPDLLARLETIIVEAEEGVCDLETAARALVAVARGTYPWVTNQVRDDAARILTTHTVKIVSYLGITSFVAQFVKDLYTDSGSCCQCTTFNLKQRDDGTYEGEC